ncbi:FMN reductase [Cloacibacterium rupense]|uniref:FMN reductase n=1 Tax=Cloacibacterium rupense TaxID=517423 RepID=A0ABQ2NFR1_9FLAO|nr:NAD(P)H-dependent oxidoreductase [Cloacibacterium rupense]GGP01342.1 FMN reductase [Cloacibacterium rupense]
MKILAFAGSNSSTSINKQWVTFVSRKFENSEIEILDLNDYEMPIYSSDREKNDGLPKLAYDFAQKIDTADLLLVSLAEHNGNYSSAFKNLLDWVSRIPERKIFGEKPMFLMATSPGKRGGASVLEIAEKRFPFDGAKIVETFSLPFFYETFDNQNGISETEKAAELEEKVKKVIKENFS